MAEDVLRHAGFVEHVNYEKQVAVEGGRTIPDFTFFLPKGQVLYMDVKFPLAAYLRYLEASTDAEREAHKAGLPARRPPAGEGAGRSRLRRRRHARSTRCCSSCPTRAVSGFIHEHDPDLLDDALRQKVVLCSPLNLFVLLGVIRQAHDNFAVERTADDMLATLGAFHLQWGKFTEALDTVEKRLESVRRGFEDLNGTAAPPAREAARAGSRTFAASAAWLPTARSLRRRRPTWSSCASWPEGGEAESPASRSEPPPWRQEWSRMLPCRCTPGGPVR